MFEFEFEIAVPVQPQPSPHHTPVCPFFLLSFRPVPSCVGVPLGSFVLPVLQISFLHHLYKYSFKRPPRIQGLFPAPLLQSTVFLLSCFLFSSSRSPFRRLLLFLFFRPCWVGPWWCFCVSCIRASGLSIQVHAPRSTQRDK